MNHKDFMGKLNADEILERNKLMIIISMGNTYVD